MYQNSIELGGETMKRDNLIWGFLLILAGVLFLGDSLNIFNVNVWGLSGPSA